LTGESILVVDDNPLNVKLLRVLLTKAGYDVRTAGDAEEALRMLGDAYRPRLILLDIQLPGMDGYQLVQRLRGDPEHRRIPVLAVTSYAMKGDEQKALDAGCDGYIPKPIDTRTLPDVVAKHLSKS
jgi:CheY-like chemotaxis protein